MTLDFHLVAATPKSLNLLFRSPVSCLQHLCATLEFIFFHFVLFVMHKILVGMKAACLYIGRGIKARITKLLTNRWILNYPIRGLAFSYSLFCCPWLIFVGWRKACASVFRDGLLPTEVYFMQLLDLFQKNNTNKNISSQSTDSDLWSQNGPHYKNFTVDSRRWLIFN